MIYWCYFCRITQPFIKMGINYSWYEIQKETGEHRSQWCAVILVGIWKWCGRSLVQFITHSILQDVTRTFSCYLQKIISPAFDFLTLVLNNNCVFGHIATLHVQRNFLMMSTYVWNQTAICLWRINMSFQQNWTIVSSLLVYLILSEYFQFRFATSMVKYKYVSISFCNSILRNKYAILNRNI